jgi:hypothetical protein
MVEEELQELKLPLRESHLTALVLDQATRGIQPQPLELPDTAVPEIKPILVSKHLGFDYLKVDGRSLLGRRLQVGQVALDTGQDPSFELEEIRIDAHPMARVFPARGGEVFTIERLGRASVSHFGTRFLPSPTSRFKNYRSQRFRVAGRGSS